jgi:hypothetical protein
LRCNRTPLVLIITLHKFCSATHFILGLVLAN